MRSDSNHVWIEVERDEMVTLTPGFKRHVTLRCRQPPQSPTKVRCQRRERIRRNGANDSNATEAASRADTQIDSASTADR
jgi:hypothetical protein